MAMDASQLLASESFSYSWLLNVKPSWDGFDKSEDILIQAQNFDFDVSVPEYPSYLLDADVLFSDGLIRPVFVDPSVVHDSSTSGSSLSVSESITVTEVPSNFLRKWRKFSKRILQKSLGYLRPFHRRIKVSRKSNKVDDFDRRLCDVTSWRSSPQASPQQSASCSQGASYDIESSINEAILHCKRSIGMSFQLFLFFNL